MSRGLSRITLLLVEAFESQLSHGAGDLTPELDEIAIALKRKGMSLNEARAIIDARLDSALRELTNRGWTSVKVTQYFLLKYKGQTPDHPERDSEIARCVAGRGPAMPTSAIHFCLSGADCILFIEASIHGLQSGNGATGSTLSRMKVAAESGMLSSDGVDRIVARVPQPVKVGAGRRIAAKAKP